MEIPRFFAWIAMDSWKKLQKKMLKRVQYKLQITKSSEGIFCFKNKKVCT
jgi:hypothetical protein